MNTRENAQAIADLLNDLARLDPIVAKTLVLSRYECNADVADHPNFLVADDLPHVKYAIGFLGVINALFDATHRIAISLDANDLSLVGFEVVDVSGKGGPS